MQVEELNQRLNTIQSCEEKNLLWVKDLDSKVSLIVLSVYKLCYNPQGFPS